MAFTRRELAFVAIVCFSLTFQATNFAMMAAFFPIYAAGAGVSITQTNVVFIAYSVAKMAMSPVAGELASRFGRRPVLVGGIGLVGVSTIFIGVLMLVAIGSVVFAVTDGDPMGVYNEVSHQMYWNGQCEEQVPGACQMAKIQWW